MGGPHLSADPEFGGGDKGRVWDGWMDRCGWMGRQGMFRTSPGWARDAETRSICSCGQHCSCSVSSHTGPAASTGFK